MRGGWVGGQCCVNGQHNVFIGDMKEWATWAGAICADECVEGCIVMEEGEYPGCQSFDRAAGVGYGMVCNDLTAPAIFLVINV